MSSEAVKEKTVVTKKNSSSLAFLITNAIINLGNKRGSSLKAIVKYIDAEKDRETTNRSTSYIKKAVKQLIAKGVLKSNTNGLSGSFSLTSERKKLEQELKKHDKQKVKKSIKKKTSEKAPISKKPATEQAISVKIPAPKKTLSSKKSAAKKSLASKRSAPSSSKNPALKEKIIPETESEESEDEAEVALQRKTKKTKPLKITSRRSTKQINAKRNMGVPRLSIGATTLQNMQNGGIRSLRMRDKMAEESNNANTKPKN